MVTPPPEGRESFYEALGRELRALGIELIDGLDKPQVVLARGRGGGYLAFYTLGWHVPWWGPMTYVCAKIHEACNHKPWLTWALVLHDGSGAGFVSDAEAFDRRSGGWTVLQAGKADEHYSLKPADLQVAGALEFGGPKTC